MNIEDAILLAQGIVDDPLSVYYSDEKAAIKALLESIEHYREVIAAMACQPESIEPAPYALRRTTYTIPNQQFYSSAGVLLGHESLSPRTKEEEDKQIAYIQSLLPKV